jgi:hypothetical protein
LSRPPDEHHLVAGTRKSTRDSAQRESLAIPPSVRAAVDDRDNMVCRVCGKYQGDARALHHIRFGGDDIGMGGRRVHNIDEIVTVCWMYGGNCHDRVHANKHEWQELLFEVVRRPGVTAMQLRRWRNRNAS